MPDSPDPSDSSTTVGVGTGPSTGGGGEPETFIVSSPPPTRLQPESPSLLEPVIAKLGLGAVVAFLFIALLKFVGVI